MDQIPKKHTAYLSNTRSMSILNYRMMINYSFIMSSDFFLVELDRMLEELAFETEFNIPELCKILALSRTSLHRKITKHAGKSISIYIREFRLKKAYELLQEEGASVTEVAYAVGFSDLSYFSKSFKALYLSLIHI